MWHTDIDLFIVSINVNEFHNIIVKFYDFHHLNHISIKLSNVGHLRIWQGAHIEKVLSKSQQLDTFYNNFRMVPVADVTIGTV